jgi:DNA polymerase III sliding clamp (beta) subunit (PCNA family)
LGLIETPKYIIIPRSTIKIIQKIVAEKKIGKGEKKIKIRVNEQSLFGAVIGLRQASRLIYIRVRQPNKC